MILRPQEPRTELVARIGNGDGKITASLPAYDDEFRKAVKSQRLYWDGDRWTRTIGQLAGDPKHRAADLVCHLIASGFVVDTPDDIAELAQTGNYEPECLRWIRAYDDDGREEFRVWWRWPVDDWTRATKLTDSRYNRKTKSIHVPLEMYAEIQDFADMHGYRFTGEARALIEKAKAQREKMLDVDMAMPEPRTEPRGAVLLVANPAEFADVPYRDFRLKTDLLPHQVPAVDKIAQLRIGALFMEMGLGKTRCTIELAHIRRQRISNIVWFCPVSLKDTIDFEIRKHTDCEPNIFDDSTNMRNVSDSLWHIVGIESVSSSDRVALTANSVINKHSFVVVDESSYIKGHNSKRTKRITRMAERAKYKTILTGTPLSQGVVDLYAQMRFLSPSILGYQSFYSFAANHLEFHPDYPNMVVRSHKTDYLAEKIAPFAYQVTKDEAGLKLPEKLYDSRYCSMTDEQANLYNRAKYEILLGCPDDLLDSYVIFQLFTALQQIASGFWNRSGETIEVEHNRIDCLLSAISSIPEGKQIIIWCKFIHSLKAIAEKLDNVALYYGDLNEKERAAELESFRNGDARFLMATMATGGHGLTLNEAAYSIFYENGFKYSERLQAEDRCHRIGQTRRPTYIDIVVNCGIDRHIQDALARKANLAADFKRKVDMVKKL